MEDKSCGDSVMSAQQTLQFASRGSIPTSPHQFRVKVITPQLACRMNKIWHSRLPKVNPSNIIRNRHYICFGLYYGTKCYAVGLWSSPVARKLDNGFTLELRRYAIKQEAPKNTASWGLKRMRLIIKKRIPEIKLLISYQDTAVHKGTIYKSSGWIAKNKTKFAEWNVSRKRNKQQATGDKIRWEWIMTDHNTQAVPTEQSLNRNLTEFYKKENSQIPATQELR